jgi:hypothetical protein
MWSIPAAGWNTLQKALDWANRQEDHAIERPILLRKGVDHEFSGNFVPFVAKKQNHYSHRTPIMNRLLPLPGQVKCGFGTNSVCPILEADGSKNTKIHKKILSRQVDALRRSSVLTAVFIHPTLLWPIYAKVDRQRERCFDTLRRTVEGGCGNGLFVAAGGDAAVPASGCRFAG